MRSRSCHVLKLALNFDSGHNGEMGNDIASSEAAIFHPSILAIRSARDVGTSTPWSVTSLQRSPSFASLASL